jgi:uncharacterized protein YuzE
METRLSFKYDREADILYIDRVRPYPEQETEELGDDVLARLNPITGEVEALEGLFFSTRLLRQDLQAGGGGRSASIGLARSRSGRSCARGAVDCACTNPRRLHQRALRQRVRHPHLGPSPSRTCSGSGGTCTNPIRVSPTGPAHGPPSS